MLRKFVDSVYAAADQVLLSGGSFVVIFVLLRWSDAGVVGRVALVGNLLTISLLAYKAFAEPFTVFAAGEHPSNLRTRIREAMVLHIPLLWVLGVTLSLSLGLLWFSRISTSFLILLLTLALISASLLYEFARRTLWVSSEPGRAALLSLARLVALLVVMVLIRNKGVTVTVVVGLVWMLSFRLVSLPVWFSLWIRNRNDLARTNRQIALEYWQFGRWVLLRAGLAYLAGNVYVPVVAVLLGFDATGMFEVGRQLVAPFYVLPMGLSLYALPRLTAIRKKSTAERFLHFRTAFLVAWFIGSGAAALVFARFGSYWLNILVASDATALAIENSITVLSVLGFAMSMNIGSEVLMYSADRPRLGWRPMAVAATINGIIGIPLVVSYGVPGAFIGNAATSLLATVLLVRVL